jgi:hypothetical protein
MRVSIDTTDIKSVKGSNDRGPWEIRTQTGYADLGKRYPSEVKVRLKEGEGPYAPGDYEVDLSKSAYVSKYGSLALSEELVLMPVSAAAKPQLKAA